jgi:NTP pyrophosphatase (non-canonical NTP hydrolase)
VYDELVEKIVAFRDARGWKKSHSSRNLAASIVIEAAELLQLFQWCEDTHLPDPTAARKAEIEDEVADLFIYLFTFCHDLGIDVASVVNRKIERNEARYSASMEEDKERAGWYGEYQKKK